MTQGVLVPQHFLAPNSAETTRTASQKLDTALGRLALADADDKKPKPETGGE